MENRGGIRSGIRMDSLIVMKPSITDMDVPAEEMGDAALLCVCCRCVNLVLCQLGLL